MLRIDVDDNSRIGIDAIGTRVHDVTEKRRKVPFNDPFSDFWRPESGS
jgi:hypothetical protein